MTPTVQWPTWLMLSVCYAGIGLVTYSAHYFSTDNLLWVMVPVLSVFLALHSSLQHEFLHGNPFKQRWLNDLLGFPAPGIFIGYQRFKATHLAHHHDENLTDPYDDPESQYQSPHIWHTHPGWLQRVYRFNNTLLGRMLIGPALGTALFYRAEYNAWRNGDSSIQKAYAWHLLGILLAAAWILGIAQWPVMHWLVASYFALSLLRVRTFLEHQAKHDIDARTAIVNDSGFFAYLFLFNNLHTVHHKHPRMPWYQLPRCYQKHKIHFDRSNDHYFYDSYAEVFKRYFFSTKDPVPHPFLGQAFSSVSGGESVHENENGNEKGNRNGNENVIARETGSGSGNGDGDGDGNGDGDGDGDGNGSGSAHVNTNAMGSNTQARYNKPS